MGLFGWDVGYEVFGFYWRFWGGGLFGGKWIGLGLEDYEIVMMKKVRMVF